MQPRMCGGKVIETSPLVVVQILGFLPERPTRVIENLAFTSSALMTVTPTFAHLVPGVATNLAQRVTGPLHDVKRVGAQSGAGASPRDDLFDPGCPVSTDVGDYCGGLFAQEVKETTEGTGVGSVDRVNQSSAIVIDHHEQEAVEAPVGDLVDADARDTLEQFVVVEIGHDPRDDLANGAPRAAQQSTGGRR